MFKFRCRPFWILGTLVCLSSVLTSSLSAAPLAGHTFTRTTVVNFPFSSANGNYAAITFNPLTQTYFMSDNQTDKVFELQPNGNLIRTIDVSGLKRSGVATTDAEGIAWMHGPTFALALHDGKEIVVLDIVSNTTTLVRSTATIYDVSSGPGKPKGLTYAGWEDSFYWVTKDSPKTVIKAKINIGTGKIDTVWEKNADNLPVLNLADVALFPRLSPNLFLISESSQTVMEVDVTGATPTLISSMSLASWPIPQAGGVTFEQSGKMSVVGKHVSGVPEDDFNVFTPSPSVPNQAPVAIINLSAQ